MLKLDGQNVNVSADGGAHHCCRASEDLLTATNRRSNESRTTASALQILCYDCRWAHVTRIW
jgi:hypothetical protein